MSEIYGSDAYSPPQIAQRIEQTGVNKANLRIIPLVALAILAGAFIGLGALYYTIVVADPALGFAASRVLGGAVFSLGLILVIVAGAELFTGNNLMVMAWVSRRISGVLLARNLIVVYFGNFAGAVGLAGLVYFSGHWRMANGAIGEAAIAIAQAKVALPWQEAFFRGVLCNLLVCLAVWIAMGARTVAGKILAVLFPISAFVAAGFEHCVANMYFLPLGMLIGGADTISPADFAASLIPVTLGNIVGGSVLVGLVYRLIYHRQSSG